MKAGAKRDVGELHSAVCDFFSMLAGCRKKDGGVRQILQRLQMLAVKKMTRGCLLIVSSTVEAYLRTCSASVAKLCRPAGQQGATL